MNQRSVTTALSCPPAAPAQPEGGDAPQRGPLEAEIEALRAALAATRAENTVFAESARAAQREAAAVRAQLVQAAKLTSLGELVAEVAHELNNPLACSLSQLALLRRDSGKVRAALEPQGSERFGQRLEAVGAGLERIRAIVSRLQTYSRMGDGTSQPVEVAEALGIVLAMLEHRTRGSGVVLHTDVQHPGRIECDPGLFYQSVMNLVVNALDALEGTGEVHIRAGADGGDYVVRVVDTGPGIPESIRARVFEPFFTTKPSGKGTGLGLAIASAVVQGHGGALELRAATGGGTEAEIRLPLGRVAPGFVP